jgi:hypothetical protein
MSSLIRMVLVGGSQMVGFSEKLMRWCLITNVASKWSRGSLSQIEPYITP